MRLCLALSACTQAWSARCRTTRDAGWGDEDPPLTAGWPARVLDAVRDRALGDVTPASPHWAAQPETKRVEWWIRRIAVGAALAAAAPRFAGALADRIPLQAALGASATGLAVCAVARERGNVAPADWVPLLAQVIFNRKLAGGIPAPMPAAEESEDQLEARRQRHQRTAQRHGRSGARCAAGRPHPVAPRPDLPRSTGLFDERPRGGLLARTLAKLPVIGVAGGWLDERGAIRKAAKQTQRLIA